MINRKKRMDFSEKDKKLEKKRQKGLCFDCNLNYPHLQFHHNDGDNSNNDIRNCVALCPNCHDLRDRKMKNSKISPFGPFGLFRIDPVPLLKLKLMQLKRKEPSPEQITRTLEIFKEFGLD